jgi:hypothetical protein
MVYMQDSIVLFGDSITEGGYELFGIAARLSRTLALDYPPPLCNTLADLV